MPTTECIVENFVFIFFPSLVEFIIFILLIIVNQRFKILSVWLQERPVFLEFGLSLNFEQILHSHFEKLNLAGDTFFERLFFFFNNLFCFPSRTWITYTASRLSSCVWKTRVEPLLVFSWWTAMPWVSTPSPQQKRKKKSFFFHDLQGYCTANLQISVFKVSC